MRVGLCFIATGKYQVYLDSIVSQAYELFVPNQELSIFVYSDGDPLGTLPVSDKRLVPVIHTPVKHMLWPGPTLYRYHMMLSQPLLQEMDYVYYLDVDMCIIREVSDLILDDLVGTIHPGFCEKHRKEFTYERRHRSRAYIPVDRGTRYYAGAFQGGKASRYLAACKEMADNIDADEENHITAIWHDESHWNRYLAFNEPSLTLSHEYCCPDQWRPETQVITIRGKNNNEMRS